ncbi:MAG: response regulator transcription factor [Gammaproteobacteria bacterium]|nr:response regulator transcription factor [Gammaproteobacteria bacterium]
MTPYVYVVDDDQSVRNSLQWLLESVGIRTRVFADARSFLDTYQPGSPGCLVLDVRMPGMSGLDLQQQLRELEIDVPVIIVTGHADVPMAIRAMKDGAVDFIEKPYSDQILLERIQAALASDVQEQARRERVARIRANFDHLTFREKQIFERIVAGKPNKAIATELSISVKTVEVHRSRLMSKMQAGSLSELVKQALLLADVSGKL